MGAPWGSLGGSSGYTGMPVPGGKAWVKDACKHSPGSVLFINRPALLRHLGPSPGMGSCMGLSPNKPCGAGKAGTHGWAPVGGAGQQAAVPGTTLPIAWLSLGGKGGARAPKETVAAGAWHPGVTPLEPEPCQARSVKGTTRCSQLPHIPRGLSSPPAPSTAAFPSTWYSGKQTKCFSFPKAKHGGCLSCSRAAQQLLHARPGEGAGSQPPHQQHQGWAVPEPWVRRSSLLQAAARSGL